MKKKQSAQSTLEYLVLVTAVVVVILAYAGRPDQGFQGTLKGTMEKASDTMSDVAGQWSGSMQQ